MNSLTTKVWSQIIRFKLEIGLMIIGSTLALGAALVVIQWLRPDLVKATLPADLRIVQESNAVPPFYSLAISPFSSEIRVEHLLSDPVVGVRNAPLEPARMFRGPHDVLGFRNLTVPNKIEILIVGDSQTYGNNVLFAESWPSVVKAANPQMAVYQAAVGGWSGPHYAEAVTRLLPFHPRVVVVAFYMGNDAAEAFRASRNIEAFVGYKINTALTNSDISSYPFPPPDADAWRVPLSVNDGELIEVSFTPKLRWVSNDLSSPAIREGIEILKESMRRIVAETARVEASVLFALIPTKESAFAPILQKQSVTFRDDYKALIEAERSSRGALLAFAGELNQRLENSGQTVSGVDCTAALQERVASNPVTSYPVWDGHPIAGGYAAIAECVSAALPAVSSDLEDGFYKTGSGGAADYYLVKDSELFAFPSLKAVRARGFDPRAAKPLPKWVGLSPPIAAVLE